jgi:hypothetical protein
VVVEWIKQLTLTKSNCITLIGALEKADAERAHWAGLIKEIRAVSNLLPGYMFRHVRREANIVAHKLAHKAIVNQECVVMRFSMPEDVCSQVMLRQIGVVIYPWHVILS